MVHLGKALHAVVDPVGGERADEIDRHPVGVAGAALDAGGQPGGVAEGGAVGLGGGGVEPVVGVQGEQQQQDQPQGGAGGRAAAEHGGAGTGGGEARSASSTTAR